MGIYDQPAILDYVSQETGSDTVSYVGYSQGTTQMYHALAVAADDEDLKASLSVVDKFISIAPCLYTGPPVGVDALKDLRKQVTADLKALDAVSSSYVFGDFNNAEFQYEYCSKVEVDLKVNPLC